VTSPRVGDDAAGNVAADRRAGRRLDPAGQRRGPADLDALDDSVRRLAVAGHESARDEMDAQAQCGGPRRRVLGHADTAREHPRPRLPGRRVPRHDRQSSDLPVVRVRAHRREPAGIRRASDECLRLYGEKRERQAGPREPQRGICQIDVRQAHGGEQRGRIDGVGDVRLTTGQLHTIQSLGDSQRKHAGAADLPHGAAADPAQAGQRRGSAHRRVARERDLHRRGEDSQPVVRARPLKTSTTS
jgi:hypothetical protein